MPLKAQPASKPTSGTSGVQPEVPNGPHLECVPAWHTPNPAKLYLHLNGFDYPQKR